MAGQETIYILHEVRPKPGQAQRFLAAYLERYAPGARARGMTLVHTLVSPPLWLEDESNTLQFLWSVTGAAGVWGSYFASRSDESVERWWWQEAAPLLESRVRRVLAAADDVAGLCDV